MITFKIQGAKYQLPTAWGDVTYQQYVALLSLPDSLLHQINLFTGIGLNILFNAELRNLEKISMALSFINLSPKFEEGPTKMVGKYVLPKDCTIESLGQFEDLRGLCRKLPITPEGKLDLSTVDKQIKFADLSLEACAIYAQKIRDSKYDSDKVGEVKEELRNENCIEIIRSGSFFLSKPMRTSVNTKVRFQMILQRLRRLLLDLPGYQKSLDFLQPSSKQPKE